MHVIKRKNVVGKKAITFSNYLSIYLSIYSLREPDQLHGPVHGGRAPRGDQEGQGLRHSSGPFTFSLV